MKRLNKIQINSERLMKNEDLVTLRGGYGTGCCICKNWQGETIGVIAGTTIEMCNWDCFSTYGTGYGVWNCIV